MSAFVVAVVFLSRQGARDAEARAERARAVDALARERGGRLVSLGAWSMGFAFAPAAAAHALTFVAMTARTHGLVRAGLARGELAPVAGNADDGRPWLACGPGLETATSLARRARADQVMCAADVAEQLGTTIAPLGRRASRASRVRLDARAPFRAEREAILKRLHVPAFVGDARARVVPRPGAVVVVRAPRGAGGSRLLAELVEAAPRALLVTPAGQGVAPLGALRDAVLRGGLGRATTSARASGPPGAGAVGALESHVAALRAGRFVDSVTAARVVRLAVAYGAEPRPPGLIAVDDAELVDAATLDAVARAVTEGANDLAVVVRLGPGETLPSALAALPTVGEVPLGELRDAEALTLASACLEGGLEETTLGSMRKQVPRAPLAIVATIAAAVVAGDLRPGRDGRFETRRARQRPLATRDVASAARRLVTCLGAEDRRVLALLAVLGGTAPYDMVLRALGPQFGGPTLDAALGRLSRGVWLAPREDGALGIASRSLAVAIADALSDDERADLHRLAAAALRGLDGGPIPALEAAGHEAAYDRPRAAASMLEAARAAERAGLAAGAVHLATRAVALDPSLDDQASMVLLRAGAGPRPTTVGRTASEKLHATRPHASPSHGTPSPAPASRAARSDDALDRWLESRGATPENPQLHDHLRAMAHVGRGEATDAVRMLRRTRADLDPADLSGRCRTSLALGVALSAAGRVEEALLEGLDGLARAREAADDAGGRACLAFLSKLYASLGRIEDATRLSPS